MRTESPRFVFALVAAGLLLTGCAQFDRQAAPVDVVDDDAFCRANGVAPGSAAYVACRKDRDVAASRAGSSGSRIERAHRNLAEDMLNNR